MRSRAQSYDEERFRWVSRKLQSLLATDCRKSSGETEKGEREYVREIDRVGEKKEREREGESENDMVRNDCVGVRETRYESGRARESAVVYLPLYACDFHRYTLIIGVKRVLFFNS